MTDLNQTLTDDEFIHQFETQILDPSYFDHLRHIRIAWLYLTRQPLTLAMKSICLGIEDYATSLGAEEKFHLTLTYVFANVIALRMLTREHNSWREFIVHNDDLLSNAKATLLTYFEPEVLFSVNGAKANPVIHST